MTYVYQIPAFSIIGRVENFLEINPGSNVRQIMDALGLNQSTVATCLNRLRVNCRARRLPRGGPDRRVCWECGEDETYAPFIRDGFKHTIVSTWEPCKLRDPLLWLSFGVTLEPEQEILL